MVSIRELMGMKVHGVATSLEDNNFKESVTDLSQRLQRIHRLCISIIPIINRSGVSNEELGCILSRCEELSVYALSMRHMLILSRKNQR